VLTDVKIRLIGLIIASGVYSLLSIGTKANHSEPIALICWSHIAHNVVFQMKLWSWTLVRLI